MPSFFQENVAKREPDSHALPLDKSPRSRVISDESKKDAVALGSSHGFYRSIGSELDLKEIPKTLVADDQAASQSILEPKSLILVMGASGAGKSSFINCLTERDVKIGHGTSKIETYPLTSRNRTIFLVDTPGIDGSSLSDSGILQDLLRFLRQTYPNGMKIVGTVYLHPITGFRKIRNHYLLKTLCTMFDSKVFLVTSKWDQLSNPRAQHKVLEREEEYKTDLEKMLGRGAELYRYDNTKESALLIVDHIQSRSKDVNLQVQLGIIQHYSKLDQITAGKQIQHDIVKEIEQHNKELLELQNEFELAMDAKDLGLIENIASYAQTVREKIAKLEITKNGLYVDFEGLQEERNSRHQERVDRLEPGRLRHSASEDFTEKHQPSVEIEPPSQIPTWNQGTKSEAREYKQPNASRPGEESSQYHDLLSDDDSNKATDIKVIQNTPQGSEGHSSTTDASMSEDTTDWEEDSDLEQQTHQIHLSGPAQLLAESQEPLIQDVLDPMKRELIDRLMEEFWVIFNRNWLRNARVCPAAPGNNSPSTSRGVSGPERTAVTYSGGGKRAREGSGQKDEEYPDDRPGEGSHNPSNPPESAPNTSQPIRFACPYRKHNPRKYCVREWRQCALNSFKTIARLKGHLYRYHIIHQCQRCKCIFKSQQDLDLHIETSARCDVISAPPVDGITRKMKEVLQCKRKAFRGQTEAERWKQIYQILFPDSGEVPSPYFEPVRDNEESGPHSPGLTDLSSFEQFLRHSLPRLVRSALEAEIKQGMQPIEEHLREKLPDLVQHALSRAFLEHRTMAHSNQNEPPVDLKYILNPSRSESSRDRKGKGPMISPEAETPMLFTAYSDDAFASSHAFFSPFIETVATSNPAISVPTHQNCVEAGSSKHINFQEDVSTESLPSERLFSSISSSSGQLEDPTSTMMDMDSFDWELPLEEYSCKQWGSIS